MKLSNEEKKWVYPNQKIWDKGGAKYDRFVRKITDKKVITPTTYMLEKIASLNERSDEFVKICLCELLENFRFERN